MLSRLLGSIHNTLHMFLATLNSQETPTTLYGVPWQGEALVGDTGDTAATVLADVITKDKQAAPVVILAVLLEALNIRGVDMSERLTKLKVRVQGLVPWG